jgi:hypothetical protein
MFKKLGQWVFGSKGAFRSMTFHGVWLTVAGVIVGHFSPHMIADAAGQAAIGNAAALVGGAVTVLGLRKSKSDVVREVSELLGQLGERASAGK